MNVKIKYLIFILLIVNYSFSQTKISGSVKDNLNSLFSASVILKDSSLNKIISYTYTNNDAKYLIETNKKGYFNLIFSSLGFESKTIPVKIDDTNKEIKIDVVLKEKPFALDEVVIHAELPMSIKKDTISSLQMVQNKP